MLLILDTLMHALLPKQSSNAVQVAFPFSKPIEPGIVFSKPKAPS